jgi:hypothetical protein
LLSVKALESDGHSKYSQTWRRLDPNVLDDDVSIAIHKMFWCTLQIRSSA